MKLNIIYRCCDTVNACSMPYPRIFNLSKQQIVFKCLDSLKMNLDNLNTDISLKIFVIGDKCSDSMIAKLKSVFFNKNVKYTFLTEQDGGNARSFCSCVQIANELPDDEIVYFLEDDYLFLRNDILNKMVFSMQRLKELDNADVAITGDDYPDRWKNNCRENSFLRVVEQGNFLRIHHTTCTFCTTTNVIKKYYNDLMLFQLWPHINEDRCINKLWQNVNLYSPLPAWTIHFQENSTIPIYISREKLRRFFVD